MSAPGIEEVLAASPLAGRPGLRWNPGVPTIASPMRQAVDADNWIVEADGISPVFLKIYHDDAREDLDVAQAWAGIEAAGRLEVGPEALFTLPEQGVIAMAYLSSPWRPALLDDLAHGDVLRAAIVAKRRFQAGPPLARTLDVFATIAAVQARAAESKVPMPQDAGALLTWARDASAALQASGIDRRPCHNDGSASAFMLQPGGDLMLVDFDAAAQADPFYDLALLLNEASAFGDPWAPGLEVFAGRAEPRLINRCRLYAVADNILQGLRGWRLSAISPRRDVEFLKYGEWCLLRARMALREPGFANRLDEV